MDKHPIPESLLAKLTPLEQLSDAERAYLLKFCRMDTIPPGKRLPAKNAASWFSFVIDGRMDLIRDGAVVDHIDMNSDSSRALEPVFATKDGEGVEFALATTPVKLLSVRRKAVLQLLDKGYEIEEEALFEGENEMLVELYESIQSNQLNLPTMPDVAVRIRMLSENPDVGINEIAKVAQTDPYLAGRLIQAANSAAYRGSQTIGTVREAITRLGLKRSTTLALGIAMKTAFVSKSPAISNSLQKNWEISVEVSALAHVIAKHTGKIDSERALLAGLVHRIGAIPILGYAEQSGWDETRTKQAMLRFSAMLGTLLLKNWSFDKEIIHAVEICGQWGRNSDENVDLGDVIIAARVYANIRSPEPEDFPDIDRVPAFGRLGLGTLESDRTLLILEEAADEIAGIREFLS